MTKCRVTTSLFFISSFIVNTNGIASDANKFTCDTSSSKHWQDMTTALSRKSKIDQLKGDSNTPHSYRCRPVKSDNKKVKAGGTVLLLGALAAAGKVSWDWWFAKEPIVAPTPKPPHVEELPQVVVEKESPKVTTETPGGSESNSVCATLIQEAHEAHIAVNSLSLMQLYLLSVSEEESDSACHFFRDKYAIELAKTAKKPHVL